MFHIESERKVPSKILAQESPQLSIATCVSYKRKVPSKILTYRAQEKIPLNCLKLVLRYYQTLDFNEVLNQLLNKKYVKSKN